MRTMIARLALLVAVLLMPLGMNAAPSAAHAMPSTSMPMQHCPDQPASHSGKSGIAGCMMVCSAALPAADASDMRPYIIVCLPVQPDRADVLRGLHPETATPPPKRS
jgi:hypothetical protein